MNKLSLVVFTLRIKVVSMIFIGSQQKIVYSFNPSKTCLSSVNWMLPSCNNSKIVTKTQSLSLNLKVTISIFHSVRPTKIQPNCFLHLVLLKTLWMIYFIVFLMLRNCSSNFKILKFVTTFQKKLRILSDPDLLLLVSQVSLECNWTPRIMESISQ